MKLIKGSSFPDCMALEASVNFLKGLLDRGFRSADQGCTVVTALGVSGCRTHPEESQGEDRSGTSASSMQIEGQPSELSRDQLKSQKWGSGLQSQSVLMLARNGGF